MPEYYRFLCHFTNTTLNNFIQINCKTFIAGTFEQEKNIVVCLQLITCPNQSLIASWVQLTIYWVQFKTLCQVHQPLLIHQSSHKKCIDISISIASFIYFSSSIIVEFFSSSFLQKCTAIHSSKIQCGTCICI